MVRQLGRSGEAEHPSLLYRDVVAGVDRFLHVASGFFERFAHVPPHLAGILLLALQEDFTHAKERLGPLRGGNLPPAAGGPACGFDGRFAVRLGGALGCTHPPAPLARISILEPLAGPAPPPPAAYRNLVD